MLQELKAFLLRGDVLALAVAFIIAGAFQKIVNSLVDDIIMPLLGLFVKMDSFAHLKAGPVLIGNFITAVLYFILIGIVLFFLIKAAGKKTQE